jgi:hypothetical protein
MKPDTIHYKKEAGGQLYYHDVFKEAIKKSLLKVTNTFIIRVLFFS